MTTQDQIQCEEHRDKIITLVLAGVMAALYSMEVQALYSEAWFPWEYSEGFQRTRDERKMGGWTSFRALNAEIGIGAVIVPQSHQVNCYLSYYVPTGEGSRFEATAGVFQYVSHYRNLPAAMEKCRKAVERKAKVSAAPVYDPQDGTTGTSKRHLSRIEPPKPTRSEAPLDADVAYAIAQECDRVTALTDELSAPMGYGKTLLEKTGCIKNETNAYLELRSGFPDHAKIILECAVSEAVQRAGVVENLEATAHAHDWMPEWVLQIGYVGILDCLKDRQNPDLASANRGMNFE